MKMKEENTKMVNPVSHMQRLSKSSATFRLFDLLDSRKIEPSDQENKSAETITTTETEARALRRLVSAGLVEVREGQHHLLPLGRAHLAAKLLELSFLQLCYLALARKEMQTSFFAELQGCDSRDVDSYFMALFSHIKKPAKIRHKLTGKGFLKQDVVDHLVVKGPRFLEAESNYSDTLDFLSNWLAEKYDDNVKETLNDPDVAKMLGVPLLVSNSHRRSQDTGMNEK